MSRAVDWLAALGGLVAGVLGTLAVAAKIYGGRNESDATVSERRAAEITELLRLKDEARTEVEKQRAEAERQRDALAADNDKLKREIQDMRGRLDKMERQMSDLMRSVAQADICALAPTCPNRALPKGAHV